MTTETSALLASVCTQLEHEGKTPSIALVKARLPMTVALPELIAAINHWKKHKEIPPIHAQAKAQTDELSELKAQVATLTERVAQLEQQIQSQKTHKESL